MCLWWTKMKFMSVICVILNLHFGVSMPDQSNGISTSTLQHQENERPGNHQTNDRDSLDSRHNLSEREQKKTIEEYLQLYRSTTSLPEDKITKSQGSFPKYINSHQFPTHPLDEILPSILVSNSKPGIDETGLHKLIEHRTYQPSVESNKLLRSNKIKSERQDDNDNLLYNNQNVLSRQTLTILDQDSSLTPGENVRITNWSKDKLQQSSILHPTLNTGSSPNVYQNENVLNWKNNEFENLNGQSRRIFGRNVNDAQRVEEEMKQTTLQQRELSEALATVPNSNHYVNNLNTEKEELKYLKNQPLTVLGGSAKRPDTTRLELQGLSPDNIVSLLSTRAPENPFKVLSVPMGDKYTETAESVTGDYQNPTAEILYKMQQAQPYRISDEHISQKPLDSHNIPNILNVNKLLDLHATDHPDKRFILVHPDGKIEHVDNLEMVVTKFPHYISVKSSDLKKYANGHTNYLPTSLVHSLVKMKPTALHSTNSIQLPTITVNQKTTNEDFTDPFSNKLLTAINTKSNITHGSSVPILKPNISYVSQQNSGKQVVAQMKQNISQQDQKTSLPFEIEKDFHSLNIQDPNVPVNLTAKEINSFAENITVESLNASVFNTSTLRTQSYVTKSLMEEVSMDKLSSASDMPKDTDFEYSKMVLPNFQENNKSFSNDSLIINETQTPDTLNNDDIENCNKSSNLATNADENLSLTLLTSTPLPSEEIANKTGFLFKADENFWDRLLNDTENLYYFLFVPPIPRAERETTRTIYPNGTIVEEVIERINDEDNETIKSRKMIQTNSNITSN